MVYKQCVRAVVGYAQNGYFLCVKLSDDVLNGSSPLTLAWKMPAAYGWFEVTEMHVDTAKEQTLTETFEGVASRTSAAGGEQNVPVSTGSSKFKDGNYPYTTFSYSNGTTEKATFTLNKVNYNAYGEVYFGIAHAMTYSTAGSITIAGATYTTKGYQKAVKAAFTAFEKLTETTENGGEG